MVQSTESKAPAVVTSMLAVTRALGELGIAKKRENTQQHFKFRGVDDVMAALSPLLVENNLIVLPEALSHTFSTYPTKNGTGYRSVVLVQLTFESAVDGSQRVMKMYGEGGDSADKSTGKAQSYAFKDAILKAFSVPVAGNPEDRDPDYTSPEGADESPAPSERKAAPRAPAQQTKQSQGPESIAEALTRLIPANEEKRKALEAKILEAYGVMLLENVPAEKVQDAIKQAETFVAKQKAAKAGKKQAK
jgi:ERF superfamily.